MATIDAPTAQLFQVHSHALGMLAHAATDSRCASTSSRSPRPVSWLHRSAQ
ncbi:hypothetical protein GS432_01645 [Rhodococcus hoagii]|nr:hypothetical protein [Prescottella equi]